LDLFQHWTVSAEPYWTVYVHSNIVRRLSRVELRMDKLPVELLERILSNLSDPVTVSRAGAVCEVWANIVDRLQTRGHLPCRTNILLRLTKADSFNEAFAIKETTRRKGFPVGENDNNTEINT